MDDPTKVDLRKIKKKQKKRIYGKAEKKREVKEQTPEQIEKERNLLLLSQSALLKRCRDLDGLAKNRMAKLNEVKRALHTVRIEREKLLEKIEILEKKIVS